MNKTMRGALLGLVIGSTVLPAAAADLEPLPTPIPAPDLELLGVDGGLHRLADHRGEVVLVNFWASWCTPCLREMPSMQRLADSLPGSSFEILAVNVAESRAAIEKAYSRTEVRFTALLDPASTAFHAWQVRVLPTSFLIGPHGRVRYRVEGPVEWDSAEAIGIVESLMADRHEKSD